MGFEVRRILTAHDEQGRSMLASEAPVASQPGKMQAGVSVANIWINETMPPRLDGPAPEAFPLLPANGGAVFRVMELAAGSQPHLHKTATLDFVVVLAGELTLLLDDGVELTMKPHDTLIQRATMHGWANRGAETCRFATVIIDADARR